MSTLNFKPDGFQTVVPSLTIKGAAEALDFYARAFGAQEKYRFLGKDGQTVMHAEMRIGDCVIMLSDEFPQWGCLSPKTLGGSPSMLRIYVEDVDATFERAVAGGAIGTQPPTNQFWGERSAELTDPYGHRWSLGCAIEEVSEEEMNRRFEKFLESAGE